MKKILYSVICSTMVFAAGAQVKVGDNPTTINASSVLEVESTNKGLLLPRVALSATTTPTLVGGAHVAGMTVYNTATAGDVTPGYYYNDGTKWVRLADATNFWALKGNAGTTAGTNFLGTTDAQNLVFKTAGTARLTLDQNYTAIGGSNNTVNASNIAGTANIASFVSGVSNTVSHNAQIVSGLNNVDSAQSTFMIGESNIIAAGSGSANGNKGIIVGGTGNYIKGTGDSYTSIVSGINNTVVSAPSSAVFGNTNIDSSKNSLVFGSTNILSTGTFGGSTQTNRGVMLGGGGNQVLGVSYNSIVNGSQNTLMGASFENIISGFQNTVSNSQKMIISGNFTNVSGAVYGIVNALNSTLNGGYGIMVGNVHNVSSNYGYALGSNSTIGANSDFGFALGSGNTIAASNSNSWAIGTGATTTAANQFVSRFSGGYVLYSTASGSTGVTLAPGGTAFTSLSDKRSKNHIENLGYGLETVMSLRPTRYQYNGNDFKSIGFIAQEVKEVLPEVVKETNLGPDHDYLGINYTEMIPVLTKAIQEQQAEIEALKKEVKRLSKNQGN